MYVSHKCSDLPGFYEKNLYKKYKGADGSISWCTICGRIARDGRHFELAPYNTEKPKLVEGTPKGGSGEEDCTLLDGGGGLPEKFLRYRQMRRTAKELQT